MARTTITFTMSLPPEMAEELQATMAREHRTRSEPVREALRHYMHAPSYAASGQQAVRQRKGNVQSGRH